jgi:hypothetical protein
MCETEIASIDQQALRAAQCAGLVARKDGSPIGLDNYGGYMIVDLSNIPLAGFRYDLTAQEVIEFCI